jgi:predicted GNAT family acetyltransferase
MTYGSAEGLAAILVRIELPPATHLLVPEEHRDAFESYYDAAPHVHGWHRHVRMAVTADAFRPPELVHANVERMSMEDVSALLDLYAGYERSAFYPDQVREGIFFGVREGGRLVAAGGTHLISKSESLAAVGSIFTRPEARGRGLATAVTAAVTAELLALPCADVILNVDASNAPAIAVYRRLGYREHCRYWEAHLVRR